MASSSPSEEFDSVVPVLVDSCLALGPPAPRHAEALCAWLAETDPHFSEDWWDTAEDEPNPLALFALLILRTAADPADPRVAALARMLRTSGWYPARRAVHVLHPRCAVARAAHPGTGARLGPRSPPRLPREILLG